MHKVSFKYKRISEIQKYFIETKAYHRYKCISKTKSISKLKKYLTATNTSYRYKSISKSKSISQIQAHIAVTNVSQRQKQCLNAWNTLFICKILSQNRSKTDRSISHSLCRICLTDARNVSVFHVHQCITIKIYLDRLYINILFWVCLLLTNSVCGLGAIQCSGFVGIASARQGSKLDGRFLTKSTGRL